MRFRSLAGGLAAVSLALPTAALAQSAGDDQYVDPLAGTPPPSQPQSQPSTGGGSGQGSAGTQAARPGAGAGTAAATGSEQGTSTTRSRGGQLPRTGLPALLIALTGGCLLLVGSVLRGRVGGMEAPAPSYLVGGTLSRRSVRRRGGRFGPH